MGGIVEYDHQTGGNFLPPSESSRLTTFLRDQLGEDYVHRVVSVEFDRLPMIEQVKPITIETLSRDVTPPVFEIAWLEELHVGVANDEGLRIAARCPSLKFLRVHYAGGINPDGYRYLEGMPRLRRLQLGSPNLTDDSLRSFSALPALEALIIWRQNHGGVPNVTDKGLEHLVKLEKLWWLEVDTAPGSITDAALAHLRDLPNLQVLRIRGGDFSAEGLLQLKSATRLREVTLGGPNTVDTSLLKKARPDCEIYP
ncbi:MAG TPA: hypothetical protein VMP01_20200 [Pirellulaceae bacterium]|nr:hypothetical protein [Pirellulaceae bacterium]